MKTVNCIPFIAIAVLLIVNGGCVKENTAPISSAGIDQDVFLPVDFCTLNGVAQDRENNIQTILWSKISGPSSFVIEHPGSLSTKVSNLQIGIYQFELMVIDDKGEFGKDIIQVTVSQMPGPTPNTAPISNGGNDQYVFLPVNSCTLNGEAQDLENNIQTILWSKISGPSAFLIQHPDSLRTNLSNLQTGIYYFELTVSDAGGLSDKDTIKVTVAPVIYNGNEVILENLIWGSEGLTTTLLWGSAIIIHNIYQYLPAPGTPFTTFIKRDTSTNWEQLIPGNYTSWYTFNLVNNTLVIWSSIEETDTPDIKLVY